MRANMVIDLEPDKHGEEEVTSLIKDAASAGCILIQMSDENRYPMRYLWVNICHRKMPTAEWNNNVPVLFANDNPYTDEPYKLSDKDLIMDRIREICKTKLGN